MGMQDRDWYKDIQRERDKNQHSRARPIQDLFEKPVYRAQSKPWHWSLIALFWVAMIVILTITFRLTR
jgi:hypothetical protein